MPNLLDNLPTHDDVLKEIALINTELRAPVSQERKQRLTDNLEFFHSLRDEIEAEAVHAIALEAEFACQ